VKKKKLWKRILLTVLVLGLAACLWEFFSSQNPYILPLRRSLKYELLGMNPWTQAQETADLQPGYSFLRYENGAAAEGTYDPSADNKLVYRDGAITRLVNCTDGYQIDLPGEAEFDFSLSPLFVGGEGEGYGLSISRETATYERLKDVITFELSTFLPLFFEDDSVQRHVMYYQYRFLLNADWKEANRVQTESWSEGDVFFLTAALLEPGSAPYDKWLHAVVYTESREYLRLVFRYRSDNAALEQQLLDAVRGLQVFDPWGEAVYTTDYAPALPKDWSEETAALYADIQSSENLRWGIFTEDIYGSGVKEKVPALEEKLDYRFDAMLAYLHFGDAFPTAFMEENRQAGRLVELTYQCTVNNNGYIFGYSPLLDIYRGALDDSIRTLARQAADWGHPFLFRLNNEMNSDWTNYSGVANLADPQVFTAVWQRFYTIFREEGVDNCIWIFNPHDRSAPPSKWNDALAYYPGSEYVQMLGVTGYNNGTYYSHQAEVWREFAEIYDSVERLYQPHFSAFPWIITEFASSGIGGDKAQWIRDMFVKIGDYENIKIAVWFSHADYDGETPARTYWLDETEETLQAFKEGLQKRQ